MDERKGIVLDVKILIGLFIIAIGVLFLLQNLGYLTGLDLWEFWPVILILIGLNMLGRVGQARQPLGGLILIVIGVLFLLDNLDIFPYGFEDFWPVILILIGVFVIKNALWRGARKTPSSNDYINLSFVLGGGDFKFNTDSLKGGKVDAVMGGGTIDLTGADIQEDGAVIETFALWGGIEIKVPLHWQVNVQGSPFLGAMENKTSFAAADKPARKLTVKGTAIMGGVEIKN
jgi:predicted membrane protein